MTRKIILDKTWAGHAFLAPPSALSDAINNRRRYHTSSSRKFVDTSLGGHFAINTLSQFTENCDFKHSSLFTKSQGMGRWYSEVLDDNSQLVHIRCGVPKFNSMTNFFGNFYNVYAGSMARTGRAPSIWFDVGEVAGVIGTLPLQPFIFAGQVVKFFAGMPRSKYYYLKPTMYPYWTAVSSFVNGMYVNLGLSPHFVNDKQKRFFDPLSVPDKEDIDSMHRIMPDIYMNDGIDVFALSTKAQRLASAYRSAIDDAMATMPSDPAKRAEALQNLLSDGVDAGIRNLKDPGASTKEYAAAYMAFSGKYDATKPTAADEDTTDQSWISSFFEQAKNEARMGGDFVTFRANFTGTQSESFSNQATEPSIKSEINAMSSKARMARFNVADGNIGGPIGTAVNIVTDMAKGILSAAQLEGFIAVAGNAFADIQRVYESSSADLNRTTLTFPLRSWSHDDWVRMKNLFVPLGAILALGLPRATGRASYDGPFLLEVYNQGRTLIREGMVESISVERGVGDVGWTRDGKCLGIDVNVTIVDLSTVLSMPINPGFDPVGGVLGNVAAALGGSGTEAVIAAASSATYSEDNKWTDWMATLGGIPLDVHINGTRKWQLNMARSRAEMNQWRSPYRMASGMMSGTTGDLFKLFGNQTDRS